MDDRLRDFVVLHVLFDRMHERQVEDPLNNHQGALREADRQLANELLTSEGVPGSPRTTKKKEGQEMPRLSLLACNAECHHANAEAEPPGMSGGQGKDETKGHSG